MKHPVKSVLINGKLIFFWFDEAGFNSIHLRSCPSIPCRCPFQRECIGSRLHVHIFGLNEAWRLVELHHLIRSVVIICTATCYLRDGRLTWSKQILGEEKDLFGSGMYKIRLSVGRSVWNAMLFSCLWAVFTLQLLPKHMVSLIYHCAYPPTRDLGSHASGLVLLR